MRISDWSSDVCSSDLCIACEFDVGVAGPSLLCHRLVDDALSQRTNFQCCTRSLGRRLVAPAVIGSDTNNDARFDDCTPFGRPDALPSKGAPVAMRIIADNISRAFLPRAGEEAEEA